MNEKGWVHLIGIAGVTTGQVAVEYKNQGYLVSGSEKGLFPPMSDYVLESDINIEIGYKKKHLNLEYYQNKYGGVWLDRSKRYPDLVIFQGLKGTKNVELIKAKDIGIDIKTFPEILEEKVIVDNSIVVSGTYGKSTTTIMLVEVLLSAGVNISYMFGALASSGLNGVRFKSDKTLYSVVEGDEYIVSMQNPVSKFFLYKPKYLLLTGIEWDHMDVFKTKEAYIDNYKKLVESMPSNGFIIGNMQDPQIENIVKNAKCEVMEVRDYNLKLNVLGEYNVQNANLALSMADKLKVDTDKGRDVLQGFSGVRRRLEIKSRSEELIVIDDFGSSPSKAKASVSEIRESFKDWNIIAIFEPNMGSRKIQGLDEFRGVFDGVDLLILPRFTKVFGEFITNSDLETYLQKDLDVVSINKDSEVLGVVEKSSGDQKSVVLFLGSHGFRNLIANVVKLQE